MRQNCTFSRFKLTKKVSIEGLSNSQVMSFMPHLSELDSKLKILKFQNNLKPNIFAVLHSIATGVNEDFHGVRDRVVYDRKMRKIITYSAELYDDRTLPIYTENELKGGKSGCLGFFGCEFSYQNKSVSYFLKKTDNITLTNQADIAIRLVKSNFNFVLHHIREPAKTARIFGVFSPQVQIKLQDIDAMIKKYSEFIETGSKNVNLIITSNSGMIDLADESAIHIQNILKTYKYTYVGSTPSVEIVPDNLDELDEITSAIRRYAEKFATISVSNNNNWRSAPISVVAKSGATLDDFIDENSIYKQQYNLTSELHGGYR